jgi:hypothetical protein
MENNIDSLGSPYFLKTSDCNGHFRPSDDMAIAALSTLVAFVVVD